MFARLFVPALLVALVGFAPRASNTWCSCKPGEEEKPAPAIELKTVKYAELTQAVRRHTGKVVVMDVWASYCVPCKKEFPYLVELHKKYAANGLVCISVSVDGPQDADAALQFLKKVKATFSNYRLDEEIDFWQEKWDLKGIPAVFVFNREGRCAAKFTDDDPDKQFTYPDDVEPLVKKLLKPK
jgi:thiol-disulfide isomerase/thioredoxin